MIFLSTGIFLFDFFILFGAAVLAIYVYFVNSYQYWKNRGVGYLEPKFPYGNNPTLFLKALTFAGEARKWYEELKRKGQKFGGVWSFSRKVLVLVDPDYIKDILVQDFQYFPDRDFYLDKNDLTTVHLFTIDNPGWKPLRQKLTPTFTSGKMKMMFNGIVDCSQYMIDYLKTKIDKDIDAREVLASFTTDVIGSVAFGVECNSFNGQPNEFREQANNLFYFSLWRYFKVFLAMFFPSVTKALNLTVRNPKVTDFFVSLVKQTLDYRNKNNIRRPDFLQLLMDINQANGNVEVLKFEQIVANTILFFIAGFDTSSSTMTFTLFLLAQNPEIQTKTRQEIQSVLDKHNGQLTYECLHEMTYLRQVIDESTRLYPPLLTLSRRSVKDYQLRDTNITIEKGTSVVISTYGLGRDPEYFPDPEKFDPDRFSAQNKTLRHQYVHLPFGEGPRNCIGLRFGIMQSLIGVVQILRNFKLSLSTKTKLPIQIDEQQLLIKEKSPIYLKLETL